MSIVIASRPLPPPPNTLSRPIFWAYVEIAFAMDETDALAEVSVAQQAGALNQQEAILARRKITDSLEYERTDPLLLSIGQALSILSNQDEIDTHFRNAAALGT